MPLDQTGNFQRTEITDGFPMAAADTDVYLDGGVSVFPDPANGEFNLVIFDQTQFARPDQDPNVEIVRATSRLNSVELAVTRGQEVRLRRTIPLAVPSYWLQHQRCLTTQSNRLTLIHNLSITCLLTLLCLARVANLRFRRTAQTDRASSTSRRNDTANQH